MILDEIERQVDGDIPDSEKKEDMTLEGSQIKKILRELYLLGKNNIKSPEAIYPEMGISRVCASEQGTP